ncbi:hypothetical protein BJ165DRAFT_1535735 [Panaeolus papilionaceus]|nr:hypothetical protein BJ165DRAFT_1535735 [Panaeolus papilionaceus]
MSGTLDNTTSWLPVDETKADIFEDAVSLISTTTIVSVAYGIVVTLYAICAQSLIQQIRTSVRKKQAAYSLAYISVMVIMGTIYCACSARQAQLEYVNFRNFPGGPSAYSLFIFDTPIFIVGDSAYFVASWMNDALLLWRLFVLYRGTRYCVPVVVGGVIFYLATFSLGLVTLIESSLPNHSFWSAIAVKFATAYYAILTAYTIVITLFMVLRILSVRHNIIKAVGRSDFGGQYLSIVAMIVESSALYTVCGIVFLALYLKNNQVENVFLGTLSQVQIIAPLLIIYRVSQGKAWEQETSTYLTTVKTTGIPHPPVDYGHGTTATTLNSSHALNIVVDKEVHSVHDSHKDIVFRRKGDEYELETV